MSIDEYPAWEQVHNGATIVDLHAHPSLKSSLFKRALTRSFKSGRAFDPLSVRTDFPKLREGGVDVLLSTVYAPEKGIYEECPYLKLLRFLMPITWARVFRRSPLEVTVNMLDRMENQVRQARDDDTGKPLARLVTSVTEMEAVLAQDGNRPIAVIHNVEGAHSLEGSLDNLQYLFDRGVAYLTLAHFYPNEAVHPCFPYPESVQKLGCFGGVRDLTKGLTAFGEEVVEKMVELGMILDIVHCTPPARARIYEIVGNRLPLIASHVGAYEINPSPYNLQDWEIRKVAESGGLVGVIFMNYWLMPHETKRGINFISRTLEHFIDVAGIDHVAIGTDFDGFTDPPDDLKDASELKRLTQRLVAEGYREEQIHKIWGQNALRVLREGWGRP
ncbi:MAG: membrane dipeptidase [Anaerolineae bacterium]|jgi:microsomal dipeptidase-like Zn-dependent dipeptidase